MQTYYELMVITRRERTEEEWRPGIKHMHLQDEFDSGDNLDEMARKGEIDSESQTVATAIGIIRYLLKNDESVKGKYTLKKGRK